jgi:excisionase family DNA binding protein
MIAEATVTAQTPSYGTPALHTAEEAAAILRVKKSWLERQAAARKIPFTVLGGSYRFTSAHLAEIVRLYEQLPARQIENPARGHQASRPAGSARHEPAPPAQLRLRPRPRNGPSRVA